MARVNYAKGSILKTVFITATPMMVAQFLNLLYNVVDRMYIGRIPDHGVQALSGVGLCFPLISIIAAFANLFGSGGAPLCAIESGKKNHRKAQMILNTSFVYLLLSSLVLMFIGYLYTRETLVLFGATESLLPYALPYMQIILAGTVFSMLSGGLNAFINAQGFPGTGMISIGIGAVLNILLDPLFIFTFHMGIQGAALATILSQFFSCAYVLRFLTGKKAVYRIQPSLWQEALFSKEIFSITGLGFAGFVMQCTNSLVQIVSNNMLRSYGGDLYISVMTIISSVRQILDTPIFGLSDGTSPILSFNYGAGEYDRVRKAVLIITWLGLGYTAIVWGLILLVPGFFISLFTSDSTLQHACIPALGIYFFAFVFQALQYAGQTVFKSLNRKKEAIFFSLFRKVVIVVPLTLWLPAIGGLSAMGVFLAEPISNFIGGSACFITMMLTVYRKLKLPAKKSSV